MKNGLDSLWTDSATGSFENYRITKYCTGSFATRYQLRSTAYQSLKLTLPPFSVLFWWTIFVSNNQRVAKNERQRISLFISSTTDSLPVVGTVTVTVSIIRSKLILVLDINFSLLEKTKFQKLLLSVLGAQTTQYSEDGTDLHRKLSLKALFNCATNVLPLRSEPYNNQSATTFNSTIDPFSTLKIWILHEFDGWIIDGTIKISIVCLRITYGIPFKTHSKNVFIASEKRIYRMKNLNFEWTKSVFCRQRIRLFNRIALPLSTI